MWRHLINRINIFPENPTCSEFPSDSPVCCHHRTNNKLGTDSPKSHLHSISCREMRCSTQYLSEKLIIIIVLKWSHAPSTHHSHSNCLSCQGMHYVLCQIMGNRTQHSGPIMRTSLVKLIMIMFDVFQSFKCSKSFNILYMNVGGLSVLSSTYFTNY